MALIEHKVIDELETDIKIGIEKAEQSIMLLEQAQVIAFISKQLDS